jgi:hypothetical protein
VVRHFFDALGRHAPPAKDVGEKGADVVAMLGAAERDEEDGIEGVWHW